MISVDALRREELLTKQNEATALSRAHRAELSSLYAIHRLVQNNTPIASLINTSFDDNNANDELKAFLDQHDISNGVSTDLAGFLALRPRNATPQPQRTIDSIYDAKLTSGHGEPSRTIVGSSNAVAGSQDVADDAKPSSASLPGQSKAPAVQKTTSDDSMIDSKPSTIAADTTSSSALPERAVVAPAKIAPPQPEDEAALPASTQQSLDQRPASKPAKTVHLPPEEEQEAQLRKREAEEERRHSETDSKAPNRLAAPVNETASSPSSTVDAHSATTPVPVQESPDTSPESDTSAHEEVLPPKELQPTPEQQREKEEHDRQLEAQKELARKAALGDVAETPDDQLRWEEKEAAAREAEERAAREDVGGPEPTTKDGRNSTEAEQVVEQMDVDSQSKKGIDAPLEGTSAGQQAQAEPTAQDDDDTIAVVPRTNRNASAAADSSMPAPSRPPRMTTRVSSGAMRQKSVSEILGRSQSPPEPASASRKAALSPEPISPMTQRQTITPSAIVQPRQVTRPSAAARQPSNSHSALNELEILKGASEDPDRDYLEPLFKIQAHDSSNSTTRTLQDLLKMVPKAISTEDHFTQMHERLDFKMLRRIYQLQNANRWSLRQMDKCAEPEQPVTHHDHMMQEMKWMRKDFREERKLKKSVCAFLARSCAEWVAADADGRQKLQIKIKAPAPRSSEEVADPVPELEHTGDSAAEDDLSPPTPRSSTPLPTTLVVAPELSEAVESLKRTGKLHKALVSLPKTGLLDHQLKHKQEPVTQVSKFVAGKVLPKAAGPPRKRSRYDYEDEAEVLEAQPNAKRLREEQQLPVAAPECALFLSENKHIRDRLHSNNAFRPPSEFIMPSTSFYEFRSGSQWIWEDDQKLRKLAKEYSFNWSLIADEMALSTRYKTSADRRTPWECFERWVELESLPADMRKTVYFKTWFQRLEQSQQAAEKRYQQHVAHIQAQAAQNGTPTQVPLRRRTIPTRVEKRRSARYLWMVDGFRKLAKKREQQAWKQAESARVAAQRKSQPETSQVPKMVKMTPQEFSKKRQECDLKAQEQMRAHRQKVMEQQRAMAIARQQGQPGMPNGMSAPTQRPPGANGGQQAQPQMQMSGQQMPNGQAPNQQQVRPNVQMAPQRNGHLAPPQVNAQGIPQAQMQARNMSQHPNMQAMMQQTNGQARSPQYAGQQYQMPNAGMQSPGVSGLTTQQQLQRNQAALLAHQQQQQQQQQMSNGGQTTNQNSTPQQMAASPSMPPPPTPSNPQQLSSGHVPAINRLQATLRQNNPNATDEQILAMATQQMKSQFQSSSQARQNAMNAAAGIAQSPQHMSQSAYGMSGQMASNNGMQGVYKNGDNNQQQQANMSSAANNNGSSPPGPGQQALYAQKLFQRQQMQMQGMQMQSPNTSHAQLNGSPSVAHASPNMTPASPSMQYNNMNMNGGMGTPMSAGMNNGRPPSRNTTPQMQRLGSSGGMSSPGGTLQQGSPRNMQASMAR